MIISRENQKGTGVTLPLCHCTHHESQLKPPVTEPRSHPRESTIHTTQYLNKTYTSTPENRTT
jgi:hypothetical protein